MYALSHDSVAVCAPPAVQLHMYLETPHSCQPGLTEPTVSAASSSRPRMTPGIRLLQRGDAFFRE